MTEPVLVVRIEFDGLADLFFGDEFCGSVQSEPHHLPPSGRPAENDECALSSFEGLDVYGSLG